MSLFLKLETREKGSNYSKTSSNIQHSFSRVKYILFLSTW